MTTLFLVIGSNSFSGSHFVRHLLEKNYQVLGLSRSEEPHDVFLPYRWNESGNDLFDFHQIDLNHDLDRLLELIEYKRPEFIVNFASQGMVSQSWDIPEHWYQTNVVAQVKLHDRLRKFDFIKKYVQVTTPEVYGNTEGWIKENFQFAPSTPYAVSRSACDMHLMSFFKTYNFPVVFSRAANVYGPGQQLYRIVTRSFLFANIGRKLQLHGGGKSIRSFIHIDDVVNATRKIALDGVPGESYHISTRETVSIRKLVEKICAITDITFEELVEVSEERLGKDHAYLLESSKVRKQLNWKDLIALDQGLQETSTWIKENLETLRQQPYYYAHKP